MHFTFNIIQRFYSRITHPLSPQQGQFIFTITLSIYKLCKPCTTNNPFPRMFVTHRWLSYIGTGLRIGSGGIGHMSLSCLAPICWIWGGEHDDRKWNNAKIHLSPISLSKQTEFCLIYKGLTVKSMLFSESRERNLTWQSTKRMLQMDCHPYQKWVSWCD